MATRTVDTNARTDLGTGGMVSLVVHVKLLPSLQFARQ